MESSEIWIWVNGKLDPDQLFGRFGMNRRFGFKFFYMFENSKLVGNLPTLFNYTYKFKSRILL